MKRTLKRQDLDNLGSLITYEDDGPRCLGSLLYFKEHGVFEPTFGKVDVTPEEAEVHNKLLDEAQIKGLDERCEVGMRGFFYLIDRKVCTFTGLEVSRDVTVNGPSVTFRRNGKVFRGRIGKDSECFNFKRIS